MTMKLFIQETAPLIVVAALLFGATSCSKKTATGEPSDVDYYTCTMHPSVHSKDPGKCPICSMDLVPVMKQGSVAADAGHKHGLVETPGAPVAATPQKPSEFSVPVERQQMIGVTYALVE